MSTGTGRVRVAAVTGRGLVLADAFSGEPRALEGAYARYLASCCRHFLSLEPQLSPALRPAYEPVADAVRAALDANRRAMLACFASPVVSTALQCVEIRGDIPAFATRIDAALQDMMPHLLFEMTLRGLIPEALSVSWPYGPQRLQSLFLGAELIAPAGSTGWRFSRSHLAATADGSETGRLPAGRDALRHAVTEQGGGFALEPFDLVGAVTYFVTRDPNPIADFEEHPEKAGNHVDLGGRAATEWVRILEQSFALVQRFLPREYAEMVLMLHQVIPVGFDERRHLSASYREALGTVYLTLHPNLMTMAEAVIHEFQHNKFNVASHSAAFISNAFHPLYKSPVRPDPRPLWGIMLAVHAFLPVAELYRRMRDAGHPLAAHPDFERRMSDIDLKNHEGMEMLRANAVFTPAGRAMFDELEQLEQRHLNERVAQGLDITPTAAHVG